MSQVEGMFQRKNKITTDTPKINIKPVVDVMKRLEKNITQSSGEVYVKNHDEIWLYLKKELNTLAKKIDKSVSSIPKPLEELKISNFPPAQEKVIVEDIQDITEAIEKLNSLMTNIEFNPTINVESPDITIPDIKIPNINIPTINVPTPEVTVTPVVDIGVNELLKALKPLQLVTNKASKPISVRMTDGTRFIKALSNAAKATEGLVTTFTGGVGLTQDEFRDTYRKAEDRLASYKMADTDDDGTPNYYGFVNTQGNWYVLRETLLAGADTYRYTTGKNAYTTAWTGRESLTYSYLYEVTIYG